MKSRDIITFHNDFAQPGSGTIVAWNLVALGVLLDGETDSILGQSTARYALAKWLQTHDVPSREMITSSAFRH